MIKKNIIEDKNWLSDISIIKNGKLQDFKHYIFLNHQFDDYNAQNTLYMTHKKLISQNMLISSNFDNSFW